MANEEERRAFNVADLRVAGGGGKSTIVGHAAVFNRQSVPLWDFVEQIEPGAFRDTLSTSDVRALFNHDANHVLGRSTAGTLRMREDSVGLAVEIDLPDTTMARDLSTSIARGDINQMSFGFMVADNGDRWEDRDGTLLRTITKVDPLIDVSPVTYPAYPSTDAAMRSLERWKVTHYPKLSERFRELALVELTL